MNEADYHMLVTLNTMRDDRYAMLDTRFPLLNNQILDSDFVYIY
jgi:hypothetical protein